MAGFPIRLALVFVVAISVIAILPAADARGAANSRGAADSQGATDPYETTDPYEEMLGDVDEERDYRLLIDNLDTILKQPINLLEADRAQLMRLPWISPWLADEIIALRRRGELKRLEDLKRIDSVGDDLIDLLRPFVEIRPVRRSGAPEPEGMLRVRVVSQPASADYRDLKTYLRGQVGYAGWEGGFTLEKDRYETRFNDFQSYYFEKSLGSGPDGSGRVIAGDFLLAAGHGLVFSNPYGYAPSTVNPWRFGQGDFAIRPYTSVEENFGLTGAGLGLSRGGLDLCLAASRTRYDAGLDESGRVASLRTTGLHVSENELEGKHALREDLLALAFRLGGGRKSRDGRGEARAAPVTAWSVGIDASLSRLNREFSDPRLRWLSRDTGLAGSIDLSLEVRQMVAFAQGALADGGGGAMIAGFAFEREHVELLMLARAYGESYLSLHARPFAFYSGLATGERGLFTRIALKPARKVTVSIGSDIHDKRVQDEGLSRPSGSESFLDASLRHGNLLLLLGEKLLTVSEPTDGEGKPSEERHRLRTRFDVRYKARRWISFRTRYENLRASEDKGAGAERSSSDLLRLDVELTRLKPASIRAGFYTFTIGEYASRIYQYEPGVPYYPVIEMLKTDGSRWYLGLSLDMKSFGRLAAKYGRTEYAGGENRSGFLFYYSLRT